MTPAFFQKLWSIVGDDAVKLVSKFFKDGAIMNGLNETNIILIPKKKFLVTVSDLPPISLCNVMMRVITKVLANPMKELLDRVY